MAAKPLLPGVEPEDYAKRMQRFMQKLTDAYLSVERVGALRWNPVRTKFNEILRNAGALKGSLHTQSLIAFYRGQVDKQVYPYTILRLGVLAQHYQSHFPPDDRGTWGSTFEDGMARMCDELVYGKPAPKGAPADRWHPDFSAAKVAAEYGLKQPEGNGVDVVVGFTQLLNQLADLSLSELEEVGQTVLSILRARADVVVEADAEEEEPLPCDQFCTLAILFGTQREIKLPIPQEEIDVIAKESKLDVARVGRLLCGDAPTADEVELLSGPLKMPADRLKTFLTGLGLLQNNNADRPV